MSKVMQVLLQAETLSRSYAAEKSGWFRRPRRFRAVDGVSLTVRRGETVALVGESGCGKSTLARMLLGLTTPESGRVVFDGIDMSSLGDNDWRALRKRMQLVFQDTGGALDPRLSVRTQVREPLEIHKVDGAGDRTEEVLKAVRLGPHLWDSYPHELSGGQLQRVIIARALALSPELLVLDEPVSALDVSIQAQIVNLLVALQEQFDLAYVFVSHDLGVVRHLADRVYVMYLGQVVEQASKAALFTRPRHPYTAALLSAIPVPDPEAPRQRTILVGDLPSPQNPPDGCRFHPRCPFASARCRTETPLLREFAEVGGGARLVSADDPDVHEPGYHEVACHHAEDIAAAAVSTRKSA